MQSSKLIKASRCPRRRRPEPIFLRRQSALGTVREAHVCGRKYVIALTSGMLTRLPRGEELASPCADKHRQPWVHAKEMALHLDVWVRAKEMALHLDVWVRAKEMALHLDV